MAYNIGGLIEATDYNGFVSTTVGANVNAFWGTGTSSAGYGQTALSTVSTGGTVTATVWASLVNTIAAAANHQGTSITSRVAPVVGNTISILPRGVLLCTAAFRPLQALSGRLAQCAGPDAQAAQLAGRSHREHAHRDDGR